MKTVKFQVEGVQPLMLNNPQVVNPFNKYSMALKPLTSKRKKTEQDNIQIYRLQFESSLYMKGGKYIIPSDHFWKSICNAAKEQRLGAKFERSFQIFNDAELDFPEKDMTPEELYNEGSHVDIRDTVISGKSRVPTCRAIFAQWKTTIECWFDETQIDKSDLVRIAEVAGLRYGVGTYRKKFGRFTVKEIK